MPNPMGLMCIQINHDLRKNCKNSSSMAYITKMSLYDPQTLHIFNFEYNPGAPNS